MNKDYEYYLVPRNMDAHTNECVARELALTNDADGNDIVFVDNKHIERKGWRVGHAFMVAFIKKGEIDNRIKVIPFEKEGSGKPREYRLHKAQKQAKKALDAQKRLKEIKENREKNKK